ncbi:hypothetical protein KS4_19180 [Poriferisphaera corsica]|uniref:Methyltransferase domain-containing protein n=1 Tax=Poriferisphaera corsica TaxID=2528020 RepID=A0A517YUF3_9BACT|nr:methyltransferase domain-containing protein [Poriferisphaera corsica]QDU33859.1 hypothetical protein KS4_19180 [Poriferisphaera corsica]
MSSHELYTDLYEEQGYQQTVDYASEVMMPAVLDFLPTINSVVDFGCGSGIWLSTIKRLGVHDVLGLDGDWVKDESLEIDAEQFRRVDLDQKITLDERYDLAISLEVGEHIKPGSAKDFVESLVMASDFVLFSAAIPGQGGRMHVNEQWPRYWAEIFAQWDYVPIDFLRPMFWHDDQIPYWYRQNMLLYVKRERFGELDLRRDLDVITGKPMDLVHPLCFQQHYGPVSFKKHAKGFCKAIVDNLKLKIRFK